MGDESVEGQQDGRSRGRVPEEEGEQAASEYCQSELEGGKKDIDGEG